MRSALLILLSSSRIHGFQTLLFSRKSEALIPLRMSFSQEESDTGQPRFVPMESPLYDEQRPRRLNVNLDEQRSKRWNDWGIEHESSPPASFPSTVDRVTDEAVQAVVATLYGNGVDGDSSEVVYPPGAARHPHDVGRIGIEIDGADYLFPNSRRGHATDPAALRRVALMLAGKLSQRPWPHCDEEGSGTRPVVLYFNQVQQALTASRELQLMKRAEQLQNHEDQNYAKSSYDDVTILCLCQGNGLPSKMRQNPDDKSARSKRGRKKMTGLLTGAVDPERGIVLIVQPTDYNDEYAPPGPAAGAVEALQKVVAQASFEEVPVVVLSPRFLAHETPFHQGWDQSGYQKSATYGGLEPARGPSPWVMRDFSPPVYCWVGNALPLVDASSFHDEKGDVCFYDRLSLVQSVLHKGHSWVLFAAKECLRGPNRSEPTAHQYIASTKPWSGRPTRDLMSFLFGEFAPFC